MFNLKSIDMQMYFILQQMKMQSKCIDKQVACVLLDADFNIVSQGINEIIICDQNCHNKRDRVCKVIHAEIMAFKNLSEKIEAEYAYINLFPCAQCQLTLESLHLKEIVVFGIKHKEQVLDNIRLIPNMDCHFTCTYSDEESAIVELIEQELKMSCLLDMMWRENPNIFNVLRNRRSTMYLNLMAQYRS